MADAALDRRLARMEEELRVIRHLILSDISTNALNGAKIMAKVDELQAQVDRYSTLVVDLGNVVTNEAQQVRDAIAALQTQISEGATPEQLQAVVTQLSGTNDRLEAMKAAVDAIQQ